MFCHPVFLDSIFFNAIRHRAKNAGRMANSHPRKMWTLHDNMHSIVLYLIYLNKKRRIPAPTKKMNWIVEGNFGARRIGDARQAQMGKSGPRFPWIAAFAVTQKSRTTSGFFVRCECASVRRLWGASQYNLLHMFYSTSYIGGHCYSNKGKCPPSS